jgi:hypothetical protein
LKNGRRGKSLQLCSPPPLPKPKILLVAPHAERPGKRLDGGYVFYHPCDRFGIAGIQDYY